MKPAIAIFAFNRPASLARLLRSLSACPEFPTSAVTVFIDGPRSPAEAEVVAETVRIAREAAVIGGFEAEMAAVVGGRQAAGAPSR